MSSRGGRGGWGTRPHVAPRHMSGPNASPTAGPSAPGGGMIPTGPRAASTSSTSPAVASRPFNPPTGPAAQMDRPPRQTLAQQLMASMPAIIPGGKLDPASTPLITGVIKELEPHYRRLREEEERLRAELDVKQEKLRRQLRLWEKMDRESKAFELKSDLSEKSLKNIAGEGMGGAAF